MSKKINRTHYYYGSQENFEKAISGMRLIKGLEKQGINAHLLRWFIHPETCKIVRLINLEQSYLHPDRYTWTETVYDPNSTFGFSKTGHKLVKIGGKTYALHSIIALTFVHNPSPEEKPIVAHKNGYKRDCRASNLVWISPKELNSFRKNAVPHLKLNLKPKKQRE